MITSLPPLVAAAEQAYLYRAIAIDPDGDVSCLHLPVKPEGMSVDSHTGVVSWLPGREQSGVFDVMLRVRDGHRGDDLQVFQVVVAGENAQPVFLSQPISQAEVAKNYFYTPRVLDPNGDALNFGLEQGPLGMTVDATSGVVSWLPAAGQLGLQSVTIVVEDGRGGRATQSFEIDTVNTYPNDAPTITSRSRDSIEFGGTFRYLVEAVDPNNDPLTFTLVDAPSGMAIDRETRIVEWTPNERQLGNNNVEIQVEDGRGGLGIQQFTVNVIALVINSPPNIHYDSNQHCVTAGEIYEYAVAADDPDGDSVVFALGNAPAGMTIAPATGQVTWQHQRKPVGNSGCRRPSFRWPWWYSHPGFWHRRGDCIRQLSADDQLRPVIDRCTTRIVSVRTGSNGS